MPNQVQDSALEKAVTTEPVIIDSDVDGQNSKNQAKKSEVALNVQQTRHEYLSAAFWYFEHRLACQGLSIWELSVYQKIKQEGQQIGMAINPYLPPDTEKISYLGIMSEFGEKGACVKIRLPFDLLACQEQIDKMYSLFSSTRLIELKRQKIQGLEIDLSYDIYKEMLADDYLENSLTIAFWKSDEYAYVVVKYLIYLKHYLEKQIAKIPPKESEPEVVAKISDKDQSYHQRPLGFVLNEELFQLPRPTSSKPLFVKTMEDEEQGISLPYQLPKKVELGDSNLLFVTSPQSGVWLGSRFLVQKLTSAHRSFEERQALKNSLIDDSVIQAQEQAKELTKLNEEGVNHEQNIPVAVTPDPKNQNVIFTHRFNNIDFNYCVKIHYEHQRPE